MIDGSKLGRQEYNQRLDELAAAFSGRYGRVDYGSASSVSGQSVKLQITVHIPGWYTTDEARMVFVDKHRWTGLAWERYAYHYDLHWEPRPGGRFAYHWHDDVFHVHCVDPRDPHSGHHYQSPPVPDIFWAALELHRTFALGLRCVGLVPLREWAED